MKCITAYEKKSMKIITSVTERAECNKTPWLYIRAEETDEGIQRKEEALRKEGEKGQINEDALAGNPSLINQVFARLSQTRDDTLRRTYVCVNGKEQDALKIVALKKKWKGTGSFW